MAAVFVGGCVRRWCESRPKERLDIESGVLCASGFVAGEGLAGVAVSVRDLMREGPKPAAEVFGASEMSLSLLLLAGAAFLIHRATRR